MNTLGLEGIQKALNAIRNSIEREDTESGGSVGADVESWFRHTGKLILMGQLCYIVFCSSEALEIIKASFINTTSSLELPSFRRFA